ncbi:MAG: hypothetical protein RJA70_1835, partial [Pseudomonadota bacterium]|jgi:UDP-N-acetylglucosamine--N-acetylmuramyl-(pentapeptide) pyrophosphoryl-undecaprenol N-acetylglucosamine transferase
LIVTHQAGKGHDGAVRNLYEQLGAGRQVQVVPFISDMPLALRDADLVVGRCGASAVSEICAVGRPALFIPYPHASGDHQRLNALSLVRSNAAVCVPSGEATAEHLAREIDELGQNPKRLQMMAEAALQLGKPEAAEVVATDLLELAQIEAELPDDDAEFGINSELVDATSEVH